MTPEIMGSHSHLCKIKDRTVVGFEFFFVLYICMEQWHLNEVQASTKPDPTSVFVLESCNSSFVVFLLVNNVVSPPPAQCFYSWCDSSDVSVSLNYIKEDYRASYLMISWVKSQTAQKNLMFSWRFLSLFPLLFRIPCNRGSFVLCRLV